MAELPHFSFPFSRGSGGSVNVVEQDTDEHVMACAQVIVRCPVGFRDERPDFGWDFPEFRNKMDLGEIEEALTSFEPRAAYSLSEKDLEDLADQAAREISIEVET
jgi:phage baseplate assembly protein W